MRRGPASPRETGPRHVWEAITPSHHMARPCCTTPDPTTPTRWSWAGEDRSWRRGRGPAGTTEVAPRAMPEQLTAPSSGADRRPARALDGHRPRPHAVGRPGPRRLPDPPAGVAHAVTLIRGHRGGRRPTSGTFLSPRSPFTRQGRMARDRARRPHDDRLVIVGSVAWTRARSPRWYTWPTNNRPPGEPGPCGHPGRGSGDRRGQRCRADAHPGAGHDDASRVAAAGRRDPGLGPALDRDQDRPGVDPADDLRDAARPGGCDRPGAADASTTTPGAA